jgi:hypothetical protein
MTITTAFRLSGQFAAASAIALAVMAGIGSAEAANTVKPLIVAPKAPVADTKIVNDRQIAVEPRQQQAQNTATTFQLTPKAPVADKGNDNQSAQIEAPQAPTAEEPTQLANIDETATQQPKAEDNEQQTSEQQPAEQAKKTIDINNLAEGDRLFEDNDQYIVMHKNGTYDTVAKTAVKVRPQKTYTQTYSSDSYANYAASYDTYTSSYSNYGNYGYGYDNCQ